MSVSVTTDWKYNDIQTIMLENETLRIVIMPELGAKIWGIYYKPKDKQLLWKHPRLKPRKIPFHSKYEDVFFGGWDELYPNDMPEMLNGEEEPDHGEIWSLPWAFKINKETENEVIVHLWVDTVVSVSRVEKWITLRSNESFIHIHNKITNNDQKDQPFLWKQHAALAITKHSRIDLGCKTMYMSEFSLPRNGESNLSYEWPLLKTTKSKIYDMRQTLPPSSQIKEVQYATEMEAGWCALTDTKDKVGLGMVFDIDVFKTCWIFATYGGWRGLETVLLEPCTGYPFYVNDGIKQGTHQVLKAGASIESDIKVVIYEGLTGVSHIDKEGNVFPEESMTK